MEPVALTDLWPILASVLGPMLLVAVALMRYQSVDNTKNRALIEESSKENRALIEESSKENRALIEESRKENRDLIEESRKENRDLIEKNRDLIERTSKENRELIEESRKENRELIERIHRDLTASLGDVRERLAHIEGHLRIPPPADDDTAAEAA